MFAGSRLEFSRKSVPHDSEAAFCIQNTKSSPYLTQGPFPERSPAVGGLQVYIGLYGRQRGFQHGKKQSHMWKCAKQPSRETDVCAVALNPTCALAFSAEQLRKGSEN